MNQSHQRPITSYPGWSLELVDKETVRSWRIGKQLTYALLTEARYSGHQQGIPTFLNLMDNLGEYIMNDEQNITVADTQQIFDIIVKENKAKLLLKVLNNPLLPNSAFDGTIATKALKQSIRLSSFAVLNLMIEQNVTILSNDMNNFDDIKSIIFNILRSVEIGTNNHNIMTANMFWNYLSKCFYELYEQSDGTIEWNRNVMDQDKDEWMRIKYAKYFAKNALIECGIYKKIHVSSIGKHYINKLLPIIRFLCEHFMVFDDAQTLGNLYSKCIGDKLFDCSSLIPFNIGVELFWSKYLSIKLLNDYLGINVLKKINENEREKMLNTITYLIGNGVGAHLDDVILPQLQRDEYMNHKDIKRVLSAIDYGRNIWNIKKLQNDEIVSLFSNVCNEQIQVPRSLCLFILSFVVL